MSTKVQCVTSAGRSVLKIILTILSPSPTPEDSGRYYAHLLKQLPDFINQLGLELPSAAISLV